jgi:hypothetical protein
MSNDTHNKSTTGDLERYANAIADWASFEREVDATLWQAIGAGDLIGACVTDQIQSVRSKLIIVEDILATAGVSKKDIRRLRNFRNSIESMTRERNRMVHDPHYYFEDRFVVARSRSVDGGLELAKHI